MRLVIVAAGRMRAGAERELHDRYISQARRIGRSLGLRGPDSVEADEGRGRLRSRGGSLVGSIPSFPDGCKSVALDERGEMRASRAFAERLAFWRDEGTPAVLFLVGGADGRQLKIASKADETLSFGPATWPHMLVRVMLAEQIYRSFTLLAGHPYHK